MLAHPVHLDPENAALANGAVHAHAAAHQLHQLFGHHQPNASAGLRAAFLPKPVERLKQLPDFLRRQAVASVFNANAQALGVVGVEHHLHATAYGVVLDGVAQQVDQRLLQAGAVRVHMGQGGRLLEFHADAASPRVHLDHRFALQQDAGHRHVLHVQFQLARFNHRQVQNFVDQLQQVPAGFQNLLQAALLPRRGGRVARIQQLRKTQNGGERRAQLMAHGRQKV